MVNTNMIPIKFYPFPKALQLYISYKCWTRDDLLNGVNRQRCSFFHTKHHNCLLCVVQEASCLRYESARNIHLQSKLFNYMCTWKYEFIKKMSSHSKFINFQISLLSASRSSENSKQDTFGIQGNIIESNVLID